MFHIAQISSVVYFFCIIQLSAKDFLSFSDSFNGTKLFSKDGCCHDVFDHIKKNLYKKIKYAENKTIRRILPNLCFLISRDD